MNRQINGLVAAGLLGAALLLPGPAWPLAEQATATAKSPTSLDTIDNLDQVMRSDPQLQELGARLRALVDERDETRKIAAQARKLRVELRLAQRRCPPPTSPRELPKPCKIG